MSVDLTDFSMLPRWTDNITLKDLREGCKTMDHQGMYLPTTYVARYVRQIGFLRARNVAGNKQMSQEMLPRSCRNFAAVLSAILFPIILSPAIFFYRRRFFFCRRRFFFVAGRLLSFLASFQLKYFNYFPFYYILLIPFIHVNDFSPLNDPTTVST